MKKKIFVLISFETDGYEFASSIHNTLEEAREAQMNWLKKEWGFYRKDTPPTKDEIYEGKDESIYYSEDGEYMSINFGDFCDSYSQIETHEIEITETILDKEESKSLLEYEDNILVEVDGEERGFYGRFKDGYALLKDCKTRENVPMYYPHVEDLTSEMIAEIEEYTGRPLENYFQIADKYGELAKPKTTTP